MEILTATYDIISEGITGQEAANIINAGLDSTFGTYQYDISQLDVSDYKILYNHQKNTRKIFASLYDNNWIKQSLYGIFTIIDADSWQLNVDSELVGTHHLIIRYEK